MSIIINDQSYLLSHTHTHPHPHTHAHSHSPTPTHTLTHTESTSRAPSPSNVQVLFKTESAFGGCIKLLRGCLKRERQEKTPLITNTVTGYKKLRWASFYVLNIVSVALVVAAIVLIALTKLVNTD